MLLWYDKINTCLCWLSLLLIYDSCSIFKWFSKASPFRLLTLFHFTTFSYETLYLYFAISAFLLSGYLICRFDRFSRMLVSASFYSFFGFLFRTIVAFFGDASEIVQICQNHCHFNICTVTTLCQLIVCFPSCKFILAE